uniref:Cylindromatosis (turban tumor syndrome), like n=1 Tax=Oreochromis niloticus TaxID=8128 RepID=A0A669CLE9_ORENI
MCAVCVFCVSLYSRYPFTSPGLGNMASTDNVYFILTKKDEWIAFPKAGSIFFMPENKFISEMKKSSPPLKLRMRLMKHHSGREYDLETNDMEQLCVEEVELLQALPDDAERLRCFRERHDLQAAMQLVIGTEVTVEEAGKKFRGVIQYTGPITSASISCPIPGSFFGIELQFVQQLSVAHTLQQPFGHLLYLLSVYIHNRIFGVYVFFFLDQTDHSTAELQTVPPMSTEQVEQLLTGRMKGIQGHCNSCYMDAALFSLFSCSSVLDSMLFKSTPPQDAPIQRTLLNDIVNPLRSNGFVEGKHIMKLRQQLQKHGYSQSFTTDEKDPEEFLSVIMHHILALDPLLKLSAAGKVQESYCYQIFLDQNHRLVLPTVQQLLEHSFHSAGLKLAEVPSCLILQMPRFGKKFKMFDKIIPSLELDVTDLLSEGPQQCMVCGTLAQIECIDCFKDPLFSPTGFKVFCRNCSEQVHSHPQRLSHKPESLEIPKGYVERKNPHTMIRDKMELFAVLCIETSHYVSFVKYGPNTEDWIFFDSMADRQGETDGFNIPEVHPCPEVGEYLKMSPSELAHQAPRDMKGVAKRLFCDAYMCLYQSTTMCLYR